MFARKLGKRPAVKDDRVPRMSLVASKLQLPPPPVEKVDWYTAVKSWPMLGNDEVGDCVQAAILHAVQQMSTYAGNPLMPTEADALTFYKATGWDGTPSDPTDAGSFVLGQDGMVPYWHTNGIKIGSTTDHVDKFMQITRKNPTEWRQGIYLFGGMLIGLEVPASLMEAEEVPFVWRDWTGPIAGGHEIWVNGYELKNGEYLYNLVSWGQEYKASENFLMHVVDEAVVIVDEVECNARHQNSVGNTIAALEIDLTLINNG